MSEPHWSKTCPESLQSYLVLASKRMQQDAIEYPWLPTGANRFKLSFQYRADMDRICCFDLPLQASRRLFVSSGSEQTVATGITLLLMIKSEARILERGLQSLLTNSDNLYPMIDSYIVLDTGSTDDTVEILQRVLGHLPGTIYQQVPMVDFGTGRTILTHLAHQHRMANRQPQVQPPTASDPDVIVLEPHVDMSLSRVSRRGFLMDADYIVEILQSWRSQPWTGFLDTNDKYRRAEQLVMYTSENLRYSRPHIVDLDIKWCYECRTHEHITRDWSEPRRQGARREFLQEVQINHVGDGGNKSDKGPRDLVWLFMDMLDAFSLKRSFFYAGNTALSMQVMDGTQWLHSNAMRLPGWSEEDFYSTRQYALATYNQNRIRLSQLTDSKSKDVFLQVYGKAIAVVLHGITIDPYRLESLVELFQSLRSFQEPEFICALASFFLFNDRPLLSQQLFVNQASHTILFPMEVSIAAMDVSCYTRMGLKSYFDLCAVPKNAFFAGWHQMIDAHLTRYDTWCQRGLSEPHVVVNGLLSTALDIMANRLYRRGDTSGAYQLWKQATSAMVAWRDLPLNITQWIKQQHTLAPWTFSRWTRPQEATRVVATPSVSTNVKPVFSKRPIQVYDTAANLPDSKVTFDWVTGQHLSKWASNFANQYHPLSAFAYAHRLSSVDSNINHRPPIDKQLAQICVKMFYAARRLEKSLWCQCAHLMDAWKYEPDNSLASLELAQLSVQDISRPNASRHPSVSRAVLYLARLCTRALNFETINFEEWTDNNKSTWLDETLRNYESENQCHTLVWNPRLALLCPQRKSTPIPLFVTRAILFDDAKTQQTKDNLSLNNTFHSATSTTGRPSALSTCFQLLNQLTLCDAVGSQTVSSVLDPQSGGSQADGRARKWTTFENHTNVRFLDCFWTSPSVPDMRDPLSNGPASVIAQ